MKLIDAATLMESGYEDFENSHEFKIDRKGVQAYVDLDKRALVVLGTNQLSDWVRYNFNIFREVEPEFGDSGNAYHGGFYNYAEIIYYFAKPISDKFDTVLGHSLGGAAAQIAGSSLKKTTMAFASPKPLLSGDPSGRDLVKVLNRDDDTVGKLPFSIGAVWDYKHIGELIEMNPDSRNIGEDHSMVNYVAWLRQDANEALSEVMIA